MIVPAVIRRYPVSAVTLLGFAAYTDVYSLLVYIKQKNFTNAKENISQNLA
jgi:hypothetical protein